MPQLTKYDYDLACKAIAACAKPIEAKRIKDFADSMRVFAKRAGNKEMEADCVEIRMRATRRVGQLMKVQPKAKGGEHGGKRRLDGVRKTPSNVTASLQEIGIDKNLAKYARKLEDMTERHFEDLVADARTMITNLLRRVISLTEGMQDREAHSRRARDSGGTYRDMRELINTGQKFGAIYADPPWPYGTGDSSRDTSRHYSLMPYEEINALPVWELAADNCVLFIWVTWPTLPEAFKTIESWGFKYVTSAFEWVKTTGRNKYFIGMGPWTRRNPEACLLGTIGTPKRINADIQQLVLAPFTKHSEKPEEVRERIERLVKGPYLELFGRNTIPGWTVWGNEVPLIREAAE
jgi:N6-adenosine-specific RNA methylase IME4